jgi:hypothetical protein
MKNSVLRASASIVLPEPRAAIFSPVLYRYSRYSEYRVMLIAVH